MNITIKETEYGLYLTTELRGCKYGQAYRNVSNSEAINKFKNYVRLLDCGKYWEVIK